MRYLKTYELLRGVDNEPKYLGKYYCVFLGKNVASDSEREVYRYRNINFSWDNAKSQFTLVDVWKSDISNHDTNSCAKKIINLGINFGDVKSKIDNFWMEKEMEKYNL